MAASPLTRQPSDPPDPWLLPEHIVDGAEIRRLAGGITRHTLIAWRKTQGFPQPIPAKTGTELWDLRAVYEWMRARRR